MIKYVSCFLILCSISLMSFGQQTPQYKLICVGFYNLENLFDTIVDPDTSKILQDDFTPDGAHAYTGERYKMKLKNLAHVISEMGSESSPDGPAVLGVSEIENLAVLEDLVKEPAIAGRQYKIVHYESPDKRGIDVALLYQEKYFKVESSESFTLTLPNKPNWHSRDQLLVSGKLDGEDFHFMVAHWPSRRGGAKSIPYRMAAAKLGKSIVDSIQTENPDSKIVYMGDLNDDPVNKSLKKGMKSIGDKNALIKPEQLYNPMESFYKKGLGTLAWRDSWNLFDQFVCSQNLVAKGKSYPDYRIFKPVVYNKAFLKNVDGSYAGYPKRTYVGTTWQGGYSDHFPVMLYLIEEKK